MQSAIMRCGSASTTCTPPASIPGRFCAISDKTPSGAFRITSTISRPRVSTATGRACASAGSDGAPNALSFILIGLNKRLPRMPHARKKRRSAFLTWAALLTVLPLGVTTTAFAQLRGHGGPVRALAISSDGQTAVTGSFDSTAIRWSMARNAAEQVLRFHADAVNAVVLLRGERAATAGADGRIAIWAPGKAEPDAVLEGHTAPIAALAASPDGKTLASASWDQTVRLWPLAGGAARVLERHTQNVNGVAFAPDGRTLVSVSYDQSVRIWPLSGASAPTLVAMPSPLNAVAIGGDGEIVAGGADGKLYFLSGAGAAAGEIAAGPKPVISIAISPDRALVAIFGRRIATLPGYNFSEGLKRLEIVWTPETVSKLFEIGPSAYTPGTKMPEQRIGSEQDRAALVQFLERATRK